MGAGITYPLLTSTTRHRPSPLLRRHHIPMRAIIVQLLVFTPWNVVILTIHFIFTMFTCTFYCLIVKRHWYF